MIDYAEINNHQNLVSITDLGSGMNYKKNVCDLLTYGFVKKGLTKLIGLIVSSQVDKIYVTHKDRLLRFGYELIASIAKQFSATIVALNCLKKYQLEKCVDW